jgi:hypothetical protein
MPPQKVKIIFRIQKNRKNRQSITINADNDHQEIFPVRAAYRIFLSAKCLGQTDSQPMAVFIKNAGAKKYVTGNKISDVLCAVAKHVHPDLIEDEFKRFSLHSGRVWALVLLDEAGMSPDFMKSCLHWIGDLYRLYLQDISILQQKHGNALKGDSDKIMRLLGKN